MPYLLPAPKPPLSVVADEFQGWCQAKQGPKEKTLDLTMGELICLAAARYSTRLPR